MSLTRAGYINRKWASLPELRKLLEDKMITDKEHIYYYGLTTDDDNFFEFWNRFIEILILVEENKDLIINKSFQESNYLLIEEIEYLLHGLKTIRRFIDENTEKMEDLKFRIQAVVSGKNES